MGNINIQTQDKHLKDMKKWYVAKAVQGHEPTRSSTGFNQINFAAEGLGRGRELISGKGCLQKKKKQYVISIK